MVKKPECSDCKTRMDEGFTPDFSHASVLQMLWHPGSPKDKRFLGLKTGNVKVDKSQAVKIAVFRCPRCGVLKSYAR